MEQEKVQSMEGFPKKFRKRKSKMRGMWDKKRLGSSSYFAVPHSTRKGARLVKFSYPVQNLPFIRRSSKIIQPLQQGVLVRCLNLERKNQRVKAIALSVLNGTIGQW